MTPPADTDFPVDLWAVRLDEPRDSRPVAGSDDEGNPIFLPFTFTLDVPAADFQPRLSRFDEAA